MKHQSINVCACVCINILLYVCITSTYKLCVCARARINIFYGTRGQVRCETVARCLRIERDWLKEKFSAFWNLNTFASTTSINDVLLQPSEDGSGGLVIAHCTLSMKLSVHFKRSFSLYSVLNRVLSITSRKPKRHQSTLYAYTTQYKPTSVL